MSACVRAWTGGGRGITPSVRPSQELNGSLGWSIHLCMETETEETEARSLALPLRRRPERADHR